MCVLGIQLRFEMSEARVIILGLNLMDDLEFIKIIYYKGIRDNGMIYGNLKVMFAVWSGHPSNHAITFCTIASWENDL